jgi:cysteinyl-tRNA synthetase
LAAVEAQKAKRLAKLEKGKLSPIEMFKPPQVPEGTYGSWNEDGIPLTDGAGGALPKTRVKNITKAWDVQSKLHKEWVEWQETEK